MEFESIFGPELKSSDYNDLPLIKRRAIVMRFKEWVDKTEGTIDYWDEDLTLVSSVLKTIGSILGSGNLSIVVTKNYRTSKYWVIAHALQVVGGNWQGDGYREIRPVWFPLDKMLKMPDGVDETVYRELTEIINHGSALLFMLPDKIPSHIRKKNARLVRKLKLNPLEALDEIKVENITKKM